jgi:hypothetical protein
MRSSGMPAPRPGGQGATGPGRQPRSCHRSGPRRRRCRGRWANSTARLGLARPVYGREGGRDVARRHQPDSARARTGSGAASDSSRSCRVRCRERVSRRGEDRDRVGAGGSARKCRGRWGRDRVADTGLAGRSRIGCSASASCGMALGAAKLVASISRRPASASSAMNRTLVSVGIGSASFWRPSRGPTS